MFWLELKEDRRGRGLP